MTTKKSYANAECAICGKHDYVTPLHDDAGGPMCCLLCKGTWHAEHGRRRRTGRIVIRALNAYEEAGGLRPFYSGFDTDRTGRGRLVTNYAGALFASPPAPRPTPGSASPRSGLADATAVTARPVGSIGDAPRA
jgi:hypothetical protein